MIKKSLGIIAIFIMFFVFFASAQDCYFNSQGGDCERIYDSLNDFEVGINALDNFEEIEIVVYNKVNPSNKLKFDVDNLNLNQIVPFLNSGVYVFEVRAYDKAGNVIEEEFEYIFDNTQPMPPIVPVEIDSQSSSVTINGYCDPQNVVYADSGSNVLSVNPDEGGNFSLNLNFNSGVHRVKFYSESPSGVVSEIVERIIISGDYQIDESASVSSISLDDLESLNERTYEGYTSKRNFYVQGSASATDGAVVYVNGVPAVVKNGKFGAFVLLNSGENEIVAKKGSVKSNPYNITYLDLEFKFLDMDYEKIVGSSSVSVDGEVNFDYPFLVFLNGNLYERVMPNSQSFNFDLDGLNPGKNFIEIRGIDNQKIRDIVYYDSFAPEVELVSDENFYKNPQVVFKIRDDIGVNVSGVYLELGGEQYSEHDLDVKDDFYIFDLENISDGSYNYVLRGDDLSGKSFSLEGSFDVNSDNTLIKDILLDGEVVGNRIFTKSGEVEVTLIPSKNIAFKSIFLDGVEQTNYEILSDDSVRLFLDVKDKRGNLNFKFINQDYEVFEQDFVYISDKEEPSVELDYIPMPYSTNKVRITGKINDTNFDWTSLEFNSQKSFNRYGDYFEAIVDLNSGGSDNLEIIGSDLSGNNFVEIYGSLLYKDNSISEVYLDLNKDEFDKSVNGALPVSDEHKDNYGIYNFVDSYDGFNFNGVYLASDGFELPLQDRVGYRNLNLEGFESSSLKFNSYDYFRVLPKRDYGFYTALEKPEIYYNGNDLRADNLEHFVQGNIISAYPIEEVNINDGNCVFDNFSFVCDVSLNDGVNLFEVEVIDSEGNSNDDDNITIVVPTDDLRVVLDEITGDRLQKSDKNYLYGGSIEISGDVNMEALIKVLINGEEQFFNMRNGSFVLDTNLSSVLDGTDQSELSIQLKAENEEGDVDFSRIVKVLYQRVYDTFAKVVLR
jgi:hypothetical protein